MSNVIMYSHLWRDVIHRPFSSAFSPGVVALPSQGVRSMPSLNALEHTSTGCKMGPGLFRALKELNSPCLLLPYIIDQHKIYVGFHQPFQRYDEPQSMSRLLDGQPTNGAKPVLEWFYWPDQWDSRNSFMTQSTWSSRTDRHTDTSAIRTCQNMPKPLSRRREA